MPKGVTNSKRCCCFLVSLSCDKYNILRNKKNWHAGFQVETHPGCDKERGSKWKGLLLVHEQPFQLTETQKQRYLLCKQDCLYYNTSCMQDASLNNLKVPSMFRSQWELILWPCAVVAKQGKCCNVSMFSQAKGNVSATIIIIPIIHITHSLSYFSRKMPNVWWFRVLKCEHLSILPLHSSKVNIWGFGLLVTQWKLSEGYTLSYGMIWSPCSIVFTAVTKLCPVLVSFPCIASNIKTEIGSTAKQVAVRTPLSNSLTLLDHNQHRGIKSPVLLHTSNCSPSPHVETLMASCTGVKTFCFHFHWQHIGCLGCLTAGY